MCLCSQTPLPTSYSGGSDFRYSVDSAGSDCILDAVSHLTAGGGSCEAGAVAAEGHLHVGHVWVDPQRHWCSCRNHSAETRWPGVCLRPVGRRWNICKARCTSRGQSQDVGETAERYGTKQGGIRNLVLCSLLLYLQQMLFMRMIFSMFWFCLNLADASFLSKLEVCFYV